MTRKIKTLGLVFLAVLAVGAIAAQAASAVNHEFEATKAPVVLTGEPAIVEGKTEPAIFIIGSAEVQCEKATFVGTSKTKTVDRIRVIPSFSECSLSEVELEVENSPGEGEGAKRCEFVIESDTNSGQAPIDIDCNHKGTISFSWGVGFCTVYVSDTHVKSTTTVNQGLLGVKYLNLTEGEKHDVVVISEFESITYEAFGMGCAILGIPATGKDGVYAALTTVRGWEDVGEEENPFEHNSQEINIRVEEETEN